MMETCSQSGTVMPDQKKTNLPPFLQDYLEKNPETKKEVEGYLGKFSQEEKQENLKQFIKFISGEMTWAEVRNIPRFLLRELAKVAYTRFKLKKYDKAENLFKALAVVDHTNWYYRSALGAVYQKQHLYEQAVDEYTIALELQENEVSSLVNRGECFLMLKDYDAALQDFAAVSQLKLAENNPWMKRAQILSGRVLLMKKRESDG